VDVNVTRTIDEKGADVSDIYVINVRHQPPDEEAGARLCTYIMDGDVEGIETLLLDFIDSIDSILCGEKEMTPLELAASINAPGVVKTLVLGGASPAGWRALAIAASLGFNSVLEVLISLGADPNAASPDGSTALFYASKACHEDAVDVLVTRGADPFQANKRGLVASLYWVMNCSPKSLMTDSDYNYPLSLLPI